MAQQGWSREYERAMSALFPKPRKGKKMPKGNPAGYLPNVKGAAKGKAGAKPTMGKKKPAKGSAKTFAAAASKR